MSEVEELAKGSDNEEKVKTFLKKFPHPKKDKAEKMEKELQKLENLKLKEEHIVKIIDFMPEDASDLLKIVQGISLDQNEINQILEIVKK